MQLLSEKKMTLMDGPKSRAEMPWLDIGLAWLEERKRGRSETRTEDLNILMSLWCVGCGLLFEFTEM